MPAETNRAGRPTPPVVWLFMESELIPDRWRGRMVEGALVPLLPEEASRLLAEGRTESGMDPAEERLVELVASGGSPSRIAAELDISRRTLERRLRRLRRRFGVRSTAELAAFLSRRGFGKG